MLRLAEITPFSILTQRADFPEKRINYESGGKDMDDPQHMIGAARRRYRNKIYIVGMEKWGNRWSWVEKWG